MKEISMAQLRQYLKTADKKEVDELLIKFFKESPFVKRCMSYKVLGEEYGQELYDDYLWKMYKEFNKQGVTSLRTVDSYAASVRRETFDNPLLYGEFLLNYAQNLKKQILGYQYVDDVEVNTLIRVFKQLVKIVSKNRDLFEKWNGDLLEILDQRGMKYYSGRPYLVEEYEKIPWVHPLDNASDSQE